LSRFAASSFAATISPKHREARWFFAS
jgi:hypothetical protein